MAQVILYQPFLLYINFREKKKWRFLIGSIFLYILALLSKETIIVFPALLMLYEFIESNKKGTWGFGGWIKSFWRIFSRFWSHRREILVKLWQQYKWVIIFFALAGIYFVLRVTVLNFTGDALNPFPEANIYTENLLVRIFTFWASLLVYYSFLFFPVNLHMERSFPVFASFLSSPVIISFLILVALLFFVYNRIKAQKPIMAFGVLWFFIAFIPMSGIIPVNSLLLEHWLYLPSIGFFLIISAGIVYILEKIKYQKIVIGSVSILIIILMSLTLKRNLDWKDPITFYNNILKYEEGSARVHNNLAMAYAEENNLSKAEKHYLKSVEIADMYSQTHYNLARLYLKRNQIDKAINHLERSLVINPNFFFSYQLLGDIYKYQGKDELAEKYYKKLKDMKYY